MIPLPELRALAERATKGPWKATTHRAVHAINAVEVPNKFSNSGAGKTVCSISRQYGHGPDAEFIAACNPATVLELLDEVERLRTLLDPDECPFDGSKMIKIPEDYVSHYGTKHKVHTRKCDKCGHSVLPGIVEGRLNIEEKEQLRSQLATAKAALEEIVNGNDTWAHEIARKALEGLQANRGE